MNDKNLQLPVADDYTPPASELKNGADTPDTGAGRELDAFRFRLSYINGLLNPVNV